MKIIEIMRLTEQGYSQREIAKSVKCGKSTVGEIQKRCRNSNLKYASVATMTNDEIKMHNTFYKSHLVGVNRATRAVG